MNEAWVEISCTVPSELADIVAEYLTSLSGNGVCIENLNVDAFSHSEIPESLTVQIKSYFSATDDSNARLEEIGTYLKELAQRQPGLEFPPPELVPVSAEDWSTS
jgi:ribosomal protein L11 methyltransferase